MFKLLTLAATVAIYTLPAVVAAAPDTPERDIRSARVRAADTRTATLLLQGLDRSRTVRDLVNELEQRDVIVYIEMQPALKKRLAGTMTWLSASKAHRYVRISINPELSTDLAISTLGHELQHAVEVANAPEIRCERTLANFYQSHGGSNRVNATGWDTEAARVAGDNVRRELSLHPASKAADRPRPARVADSIQNLDPEDWLIVYRRARGMLPP
jgi:hypothetical protein